MGYNATKTGYYPVQYFNTHGAMHNPMGYNGFNHMVATNPPLGFTPFFPSVPPAAYNRHPAYPFAAPPSSYSKPQLVPSAPPSPPSELSQLNDIIRRLGILQDIPLDIFYKESHPEYSSVRMLYPSLREELSSNSLYMRILNKELPPFDQCSNRNKVKEVKKSITKCRNKLKIFEDKIKECARACNLILPCNSTDYKADELIKEFTSSSSYKDIDSFIRQVKKK